MCACAWLSVRVRALVKIDLLSAADVPKEQSVSIMLNGEESELQFVNIGNLKVSQLSFFIYFFPFF